MNKAVLKIIITSGVLAIVRLADAQQAIFLVRHAEDVRSKDVVDRPLTESGRRRAMLLADVLKDAGINAVLPVACSGREDSGGVGNRLENRAQASTAHHRIR